jgi:hypothetical protein
VGDGFAVLDQHIRRVRALGGLVSRSMPATRSAVDAELRAQIARGEAPDGTNWPATKDGRRPLAGAAKALAVSTVGNALVATVSGPEALHHHGWVRGGVKRQILPTELTPKIADAIGTALEQEFKRTMGGA